MAEEKDPEQLAAEMLLAQCQAKGMACITHADGHHLMFTRRFIQAMLDAHPTKDDFIIFVQRPDFKKSS
jgi:hypothetical protein